ncbi:MAG: hypothetical protein HKN34_08930 [Gammaproteobacteria bacterium]|nr:hypothetical protein [Gammaproteobacteria bacterium]
MTIRLIFLCLILPVSIQGHTQTDEEELRFYDVEVIIFKNLRGPKSRELILPVSSPSRGKEILDIASPASVKKAKQKSYLLLGSEQLKLHDHVEKIVKSPNYELLTHIGWRQPGLSLEESIPVWIRGGKIFGKEYVSIDNRMPGLTNNDGNKVNTPDTSRNLNRKIYELEGKITVSLSRYLHTHADFVLRQPRLSLTDVENSDSPIMTNREITKAYILDNHSLKERRRMRSKSLHYLDSPEFSLLVLITPHKTEPDDSVEAQ